MICVKLTIVSLLLHHYATYDHPYFHKKLESHLDVGEEEEDDRDEHVLKPEEKKKKEKMYSNLWEARASKVRKNM